MKTTEMKNMTTVELNTKLVDLKNELFNLRFSHSAGQLSNPVQLRLVKRNIARVQTILRQRELEQVKVQAKKA